MEVTCGHCGGVIGFHYRNSDSVACLKRKTRNWVDDDYYGALCPDCIEKVKKERKKEKNDIK